MPSDADPCTDNSLMGNTWAVRINSRREILPTYRVGAPVVCAQTSSVELARLELATSWVRSRNAVN